jgi:hypothetical protein
MDEPTSHAGADVALREDLAPDMANEVFLVPAQGLTPMRCPDGFAAILVTCVDIADGPDLDHDGDVESLTGRWMPAILQPDHGNDGDVILVPPEPNGSPSTGDGDARVDIEMRLLNGRRWQRMGVWPAQDYRWPQIVAPTALVTCVPPFGKVLFERWATRTGRLEETGLEFEDAVSGHS